MKTFLIIYLLKGSRFHTQIKALGMHSALDKFEAEQKINVDNIVSIDVL